MDDAYYSALISERFAVLGVPLLPFSIGHYVVFKRMGLPVPLEEGQELSSDQFIQALFILSRDWEQNLEALSGAWFTSVEKWKRKRLRWSWLKGQRLWLNAVAAMNSYWVAQCNEPKLQPQAAKGPGSGAPDVEQMYSILRREFGYRDTEIFNMSYGLALFRLAVMSESMGGCKFETLQLRTAIERVRAGMAENGRN